MAEIPTPICDLIASLLSRGLSGTEALELARPVEAAAASNAMSRGAPTDKREYERLRKAAWRASQLSNVRDNVRDKPKSTIPSKNNNLSELDLGVERIVPNVPDKKPSRSAGSKLPDDWAPSDADFAYGEKLGITRAQVLGCAEDMRLWARGNANRAVGRKADWTSTFQGWMRREAPKLIRQNGGTNGSTTRPGSAGKMGFAGIGARLKQAGAEPPGDEPPPYDRWPDGR